MLGEIDIISYLIWVETSELVFGIAGVTMAGLISDDQFIMLR
jgi:hypothetical protein